MTRILGSFTPDSREWHEAREGRIGGSSIAAACGWSPYETRDDLLARMAGEIAPRETTKAMNRGTWLEPAIANWLAADRGLTYDDEASAATYQHDAFDWAIYNPDRICTNGLLVEIKTTGDRSTDRGWGRAGSDTVPLVYQAQVMWGMGIIGLDDCLLAVLHGATNGRPDLGLAVYRLRFNPDIYAALLKRGERFITELRARKAAA